MVDRLMRDIHHAVRRLRSTPGFTCLAVATLGIAIGATTALFTLVDAVMLRDLPFRDPARLVEIWGRDDGRTGMRVPRAILDALRARSRTLQAIGTHHPTSGVLQSADGALEIRGELVSANFTDVFGVPPTIGRGFVPEDEQAAATPVMLVSFSFWRQHLGSDPAAAGRVVTLDGVPYTVIGVMPPQFRTTFLDAGPAFWTAFGGSPSRRRERELGYEVVARVARAATIEDARREVAAIASGVAVADWREGGRRLGLVPLKQEVVGERGYALSLLMAAVAAVLAIACANLAQVLLARSDDRVVEFATRKAIGAGAGHVFRLALFESLALSMAGGAAGVALAYGLVPALLALAPSEIPRLATAAVDGRVLLAAVGISVLSGCAFGLAPAMRLARLPLAQAMTRTIGASSVGRVRVRSALVVGQVAAAVALLTVAGLVVQTLLVLLPTSPGFATASRASFTWSIRESAYPDVADRRRRLEQVRRRLEETPGIATAAVGSSMPFWDDEPFDAPVRLAGDPRPAGAATLRADYRAVSPGFFALLEMPVVRGRAFSEADRAEAPRVAIVNRTLARRLSPSGNAIGQSIRIGSAANPPACRIVGVVGDTRWWGTTVAPLSEVYVPFDQDRASFGVIVVQSHLDTAALTRAIRSAFHAALPGAALPASRSAVTLDDMIRRSLAAPRFNAALVGAFSIVVLLLAALGLFGLIAYSVSRRRREIAVRMALGATWTRLVRASVQSAIGLTSLGIVLGLAVAVSIVRVIEGQLYAVVDPLSVPAFGGAAILMLTSAAVAAYLPARRAARADPMRALRDN